MKKQRQRLGRFLLLALASASLTACGGSVRDTFGLNKRSPDEFQVVRRQPLVVPPDRTLRPPRPGEQSVQQAGTDARGLLVGNAERPASGGSAAERALLGAVPVRGEPDIRRILLQDNQQVAVLDQRTFLWILDWQKPKAPSAVSDPIDAAAEAQRLRQQGVVTTTKVGGS